MVKKRKIPNLLKILAAVLICSPGMLLPYQLRVKYAQFVAFMFHLPFIIFGFLAKVLIEKLNIKAESLYGDEKR